MISLHELLKYKNPHLVKRYQQDYPHNLLGPGEALIELLKYFWICEKHIQDKNNRPNEKSFHFICAMHSEMKEIDDMWHTFLLFTQDYWAFCNKYFGKFLHHVPNLGKGSENIKVDEIELTRYLSYVYDHLGEKTLEKWFAEDKKPNGSLSNLRRLHL